MHNGIVQNWYVHVIEPCLRPRWYALEMLHPLVTAQVCKTLPLAASSCFWLFGSRDDMMLVWDYTWQRLGIDPSTPGSCVLLTDPALNPVANRSDKLLQQSGLLLCASIQVSVQ
jgi:hypothetical protein